MKVSIGEVTSPFGGDLRGFEITIDDGLPDAKTDYIRERVIEILNKESYKVKQLSNTNIVVET